MNYFTTPMRRRILLSAIALLLGMPMVFLGGCAQETATTPDPVVGACAVAVTRHADEGASHVDPCATVTYNTNPPSSGTHYSIWAAYKTYAQPVPEGFLVHDLEHGALVIGYHCPEGCADEVATMQKWMDGLGTDPICPGERHKIILAPNSKLETRWAAAAWNWTWKAPCPDTITLAVFFKAHYGKTVESGVCGGGSDLSATGWCP